MVVFDAEAALERMDTWHDEEREAADLDHQQEEDAEEAALAVLVAAGKEGLAEAFSLDPADFDVVVTEGKGGPIITADLDGVMIESHYDDETTIWGYATIDFGTVPTRIYTPSQGRLLLAQALGAIILTEPTDEDPIGHEVQVVAARIGPDGPLVSVLHPGETETVWVDPLDLLIDTGGS